LTERLHSSDGKMTSNDRHGRSLAAAIDGAELLDDEVEEFRRSLDLRALGEREGILYVDAEIANCALDLRVAEKDLDGA
jgi:hypothetical protein